MTVEQTPVAELMGWEPARESMPGATWRTPTGRWIAGPPTADHLLAWLRDRQAFVACVVIVGHPVTVEYLHPEGFYVHAKADTIVEAFEIAVRTVAGEPTP